ncbi:hypothetical protein B0H65DRAFT_253975 [Neurospora tetraspora]|uniref:Uncharacterized protein n=1 Tax=Neurospora tetraspora TaxID=94610 RepID=A0AAE0MPY7_9PEZI|nr:hypothetical protein B0H65DRAFT_253975 [Neurospora tetraspora]
MGRILFSRISRTSSSDRKYRKCCSTLLVVQAQCRTLRLFDRERATAIISVWYALTFASQCRDVNDVSKPSPQNFISLMLFIAHKLHHRSPSGKRDGTQDLSSSKENEFRSGFFAFPFSKGLLKLRYNAHYNHRSRFTIEGWNPLGSCANRVIEQK